MSTYPTKWKRTTMRGCGPNCQRRDLLVESRRTSREDMQTRHVPEFDDLLNSRRIPCGEAYRDDDR